jgi:hypothetical protein
MHRKYAREAVCRKEKSFFIPNNNKQDGNKTLKTNHKHKTVYMVIYLITSSCQSCVVYGNYGVIVLKKYRAQGLAFKT